jgi:hypothetical protein
MSSPPAIDYPSDDVDVDMENEDSQDQQEQSMMNAPPPDPLFLAGTPVTTPRRAPSTPMGSAVARRALGMATPKRTSLFASGGGKAIQIQLDAIRADMNHHQVWIRLHWLIQALRLQRHLVGEPTIQIVLQIRNRSIFLRVSLSIFVMVCTKTIV